MISSAITSHYSDTIFKQTKQVKNVNNVNNLGIPSRPTEGIDFATSSKVISHSINSSEKLIRECNDDNKNSQDNKLVFGTWKANPEKHFEKFFRSCVDEIIETAVFAGTDRLSKVIEWHDPEELRKLLDFKLYKNPQTHNQLFELLKQTIQYSVKTGHPYFINQLYSGLDMYALIAQWATDSLNPSVYTYEVAPVFTLMEMEILNEMRRIVGFNTGDGIFCPGGSIANGYAISCARYKLSPKTKQNGNFGSKRFIIFTSEDSHYSVEKLAMFMGIGSDNVWKISTNKLGKLNISELEEKIVICIQDGCQPMMVSATAGTTVLGAFDNLDEIADICQKYKIWMHVDAAWGGGALVSKKYKYLLKGIERADSVTWNPHKLLSASQQCSTFLTRHESILSNCHSTNATYLFQKDKFYDTSFDTGDKHIQCGRRADVFKFWFMWKAKGTNGLEQHVDQVMKMAEFFTLSIKDRAGFELVLSEPEFTNISFWYIPPSMRNLKRNEKFYKKLHTIAPKIKERMMKKGSMMITYQPLRQIPNFFRLVLQNSCLSEDDMIYFINEIEFLGNEL